jgi:hypothetical protein
MQVIIFKSLQEPIFYTSTFKIYGFFPKLCAIGTLFRLIVSHLTAAIFSVATNHHTIIGCDQTKELEVLAQLAPFQIGTIVDTPNESLETFGTSKPSSDNPQTHNDLLGSGDYVSHRHISNQNSCLNHVGVEGSEPSVQQAATSNTFSTTFHTFAPNSNSRLDTETLSSSEDNEVSKSNVQKQLSSCSERRTSRAPDCNSSTSFSKSESRSVSSLSKNQIDMENSGKCDKHGDFNEALSLASMIRRLAFPLTIIAVVGILKVLLFRR